MMNKEKDRKKTNEVIRGIFVLFNLLLILAIVVKKISVAVPELEAFGWVLLCAAFIFCVFCAVYLSGHIEKILRIDENKAEWVAASLATISVFLLGYLFWDYIKEFFQ